MTAASARYVPAAGRAAFTRLYDPVVRLTMREAQWRPHLCAQVLASVPTGGHVVDVGAGTGTLTTELARRRGDVQIYGVDGDPAILEHARSKPSGDAIEWRLGLAGDLPFDEASADAVMMSLLLHHLDPPSKRQALAEARRVLRPGGRLHIADWGVPHDPGMRAAFLVLQVIDGFEGTRDHVAGRLGSFVAAAGFSEPRRHRRVRTCWGTLELLEAEARSGPGR